MRRAFTLVELLIALALGLTVLVTAAAAVRAAAGALAVANRLGVENGLIRAGFLAALDEVDSWRAYDDPTSADPAATRLRAIDAARGYGLPFAPLHDAWPSDAADRWDGDARRWSSANPETWWRGSLVETVRSDLRYGRSAIFANARAPAAVASPTFGVYGTVDAPRTWLTSQLRGLDRALGAYGMLDYVRADRVLAWYDAAPVAGDPTLVGGLDARWPTMNSWSQIPCFDPYASRSVVPRNRATAGWTTAQLVDAHRRLYQTGWQSDAMPGDMTGFLRDSMGVTPLLALAPASWPSVDVRVCRSVRLYRFNTLCRVRWTSPMTGESADIAFSAFGTTLRGARQARGLDAP